MNEHESPPATPSQGAQGKRSAGQENEPLMAWRAFGTEPFWNARVDGDTLIFSTPEDQAGRSMHGRRVPSLVGFVYIGKDGDKEFNLDIRRMQRRHVGQPLRVRREFHLRRGDVQGLCRSREVIVANS